MATELDEASKTLYTGYPLTVLEEEVPMTMQVGMVGTDGILVASDTKIMSFAQGIRQTNSGSKIRVDHEKGIVIGSALNLENTDRIARDIIRLLRPEDFEDPIERIEEIAQNVLKQPGGPDRDNAQCLIVLTKPERRLFDLQVGTMPRQNGPVCSRRENK